jgi:hypothetical protein
VSPPPSYVHLPPPIIYSSPPPSYVSSPPVYRSPPPSYSSPPPPPSPPIVPEAPGGPGDFVFRLRDPARDDHLFTTNRSEAVQARSYHFEFFAFIAPDPGPDTVPVFRLLDPRTNHHLLTASPLERDLALQGEHPMVLEGIAFHARTQDKGPELPVYRFRDTRDGSWFFTTSEPERARLIGQGYMVDEGIAFYAL